MTNPFDDEDSSYLVLVNQHGRHCLWPASADVPPGWTTAAGPASRAACMTYVTEHWPDIRPSGLSARLTSRAPAGRGASSSADRPTGK
jgi:uncharacterized protein YbdZ (MbtH family)